MAHRRESKKLTFQVLAVAANLKDLVIYIISSTLCFYVSNRGFWILRARSLAVVVAFFFRHAEIEDSRGQFNKTLEV